MAVALETRENPGGVKWKITPGELAALHLPQQRHKDGGIFVDRGNGKAALGIIAASRPSGLRRFVDRVRRKAQTDESSRRTRQVVRPPVHLDPNFSSEHVTPETRRPYVVLDSGTKYEIGALISKDLITPWAEPADTRYFYKFKGETVYERQNVALLVRVDGEHPLIVEERPGDEGQREKYEMYKAIPEPSTDNGKDVYVVFNERITRDGSKRKIAETEDAVVEEAQREPLEFVKLSRKEKASKNPQTGSVQLVVVRVTERKTVKTPLLLTDSSSSSSEFSWDKMIFRGVAEPGKSTFGEAEKQTIIVTKVYDPEPIAELNLNLVAPRRRRFGYRMTSADAPKKRAGYKSGE